MTITMAISTTSTSPFLLHPSSSPSISGKPYSFPTYPISIPKNAIFHHARVVPQLGFTPYNQWNVFKGSGISTSRFSARTKKKGRSKRTRVYASLFGVGAPEALVIGVVALLVFGPKGLAEVARNLGKTLRAFQPTIRELQEVSRDFKSTLEREIGLDDIDNPVPKRSTPSAANPMPESSETTSELDGSPPVTEEPKPDPYLKVSGPQLLGALAQLQKEQAEEKEREEREKEERESAQVQLETAAPSPSDNEAPDIPHDVTSSMIRPESNLLQEATSVPGPKNDTEDRG